ncbi:MAG: DNA/RNA non-specific endonuclease [Firmicutes bacterium]|nr:DNA/RNA non-specific endonuclease [Bacillota bacterium]
MIDFDLDTIPEYSGEAYVAINGNEPDFAEKDLSTKSYEFYSELDHLGRCGVTVACLGQDLMPTEDRESISHVKPSGWIQGQYDFVDGNSLYNRCHLIGFQLAGENANEKNLITGTRYMNTIGMLPFENMVADYIKETGNHVMYRVTPIYDGDNLVASGVQMEGYSVEDEGEGIYFNVYAYNVQPGVEIDYATGENQAAVTEETGEVQDFVLNTSSKKFHLPDCSGLNQTKEKNKQEYEGTREMLLAQGYEPCKSCNP